METLKLIYDESEVEKIAESVLAKTRDKIKDQIGDAFYNELEFRLNEHYDNFKDNLKRKLINELTSEYVGNPTHYKYRELRRLLFDENKSEIVSSLTDDAIQNNVERILLYETSKKNHFAWMWKENIAKMIIKNFDLFKDDERINNVFIREIDNLKSEAQRLNDIIKSMQSVMNSQSENL